MNRNALKYIAIIAMTLDHIAAYIIGIDKPIGFLFSLIGRITMPIMCFFVVEGFKYSKDRTKYATRLLIAAIVAQIPWCLVHNETLLTWELVMNYNTIFTLLLGFLLIWVVEFDMKLLYKAIAIIGITAFSFMCDYHIVGLIYILFFYLFKDSKNIYVYLPILFIVSPIILGITNSLTIAGHLLNSLMNVGLFLTIPMIYLYNGKNGNKNIFNKYFFYVYYPVHLLVLFAINLYLL